MYRGTWFIFQCPVCKNRPRYDADGSITSTTLRLFTKQEVNKFLSLDFESVLVCSEECANIYAACDPEWFN